MTFTFEGRRFRIGFTHERSHAWSDHVAHNVQLARLPRKPVTLYCGTCRVELSRHANVVPPRNATCVIYVAGPHLGLPDWDPGGLGASRQNTEAGDAYSREAARKASLTSALLNFGRDFRALAWTAYNNRGKATAAATRKAT